MTRDDAVLAVTLVYLLDIAESDRPFGAQELANRVRNYFLATRDVGLGDEATMGLMSAAFGIGSVAGAVAIGAWGGPTRRVPAILATTLVSAVATALLGLRPDVTWIGIFLVVLGFSQSVMLALNRVVFQQPGAPAVLGRVFAFRIVLAQNAQAVGVLTAGSLAANVPEPRCRPPLSPPARRTSG